MRICYDNDTKFLRARSEIGQFSFTVSVRTPDDESLPSQSCLIWARKGELKDLVLALKYFGLPLI